MRPVRLPVPIRGMNTMDPEIGIDSRYARELTNYLLYNGRMKMRPACLTSTAVGSPTVGPWSWYWPDSGTWYGVKQSNGAIYDIAAGTTAATLGVATHSIPKRFKHSSLDMITGIGVPRLAAYPFTAWTFTTGTITAASISTACSHKGRLYVAQGQQIEFSSIGQVTGAMPGANLFDVRPYLENSDIQHIASVTVRPGNTSENVLVIFANDGTVLVWSGDYPGSSTWNLFGRFKMTQPKSAGYVEIDGDLWVTGSDYCYWVRDLFTGGAQTAYINSPTRTIEDLWQSAEWYFNDPGTPHANHSFHFNILPLPNGNDINPDVILCQSSGDPLSSSFDYGNEAITFAYHRKYQAWSIWPMSPLYWPIVDYNGRQYGQDSLGNTKVLDYGSCVDNDPANDTNIDIESVWKTPYITPFSGASQQSIGVRPLYRSTVNGYFHRAQAIFEHSDYNVPFAVSTQSTVTDVPPGRSSGYAGADVSTIAYDHYRPFISIGGLGTDVSYQFIQKRKISSTTAQEHEILGATAFIKNGGVVVP